MLGTRAACDSADAARLQETRSGEANSNGKGRKRQEEILGLNDPGITFELKLELGFDLACELLKVTYFEKKPF